MPVQLSIPLASELLLEDFTSDPCSLLSPCETVGSFSLGSEAFNSRPAYVNQLRKDIVPKCK